MADKEDMNLRSELGVTRRDLLKRGAVVGGTLLWVAPVIQSITPPAFAQNQSPVVVSCCKCRGAGGRCITNISEDECISECGGTTRVRDYILNGTCVDREDRSGSSCVPLPN